MTMRLTNNEFEPLVKREVNALIKYASEKSIDPEGNIISSLNNALTELSYAEQASANNSEVNQNTDPIVENLRTRVIILYSQLTKLSFPVTGRTLIQTAEKFKSATRPLKIFTLLFLTIAIGNEILKSWLGDIPEPEDGWLLWLISFQRYVLDYCSPFLWGGLGSMTYILKRLNDYAEERTFDYASSHGWCTRIFLGAMLGGIVQYIYDPTVFIGGESGFAIKANALGFLTGVGVKVVYGAIEKTIDTLASKMNLDAIKTNRRDSNHVRIYLNEQLAKAEKKSEPDKYKFLQDLIEDLDEVKKP